MDYHYAVSRGSWTAHIGYHYAVSRGSWTAHRDASVDVLGKLTEAMRALCGVSLSRFRMYGLREGARVSIYIGASSS